MMRMTQRRSASEGRVTPQMEAVAEQEGMQPEEVMHRVAHGFVVIPCNPLHHRLDPRGIGEGLRVKVNANLGGSPVAGEDPTGELPKLEAALAAGADSVMDLTTGSEEAIRRARREVLAHSPVMVGTVPIYQAAARARELRGSVVSMTPEDMFSVVEEQCRDGVDFVTVHCGVTFGLIRRLTGAGRTAGVVSRGGAITTGWMVHNQKEHPFYAEFDRLLALLEAYDVTLSLGDGLRPGALADATDPAQVEELLILAGLVRRAQEAGVQVMVEGPGHVPLHEIEANVRLQKSLCRGAPFYVLGPLVTDVAPGYDHISAAIGGALAAWAGADFLCYVTPAEHLGLPDASDVRQGVAAARIAAHAADVARLKPGAIEWDHAMSRARRKLDWQRQISLAIDPEAAAEGRRRRNPEGLAQCSMCGSFCAIALAEEALGSKGRDGCGSTEGEGR